MTYGSLFSGIDGLGLGMERAGMQCAWQVEINETCIQVLERHWPHAKRYKDVREVQDLCKVDVVVGGSPCQDFSTSQNGRREGLRGDRSGLFREYRRIVAEVRPAWFVFENVKGMLSSADGKDFEEVVWSLEELGYCVSWRVLDSQYYGVPQHRERVFVVGSLGNAGSALVHFDRLPQDPAPASGPPPAQTLERVVINPYQLGSNGVGVSRVVPTLDGRPDRVVLAPVDPY